VEELRPGDPRQVGDYELLKRLGGGGMGQVFLGRSPGGRLVAVKVIRAELAEDPEFRTRFAREVAAASKVSGVYTAALVRADPAGPQPWLATEFVPGLSLDEAVRTYGPLPVPSVLALAAGLAEGLGAVHDAGVVHRDLKPSNVLLAPDGPRVIDFGIAQAADDTHVTRTGTVIGSAGYMSPEQVAGGAVGPASDVFSLGAVLVFAATGKGPFGTGEHEALMWRVVHGLPHLEGLPASVRPLAEHCLAKDPRLRPTARQFLDELKAAHPSAANLTDWLPPSILTAAESLRRAVAGPAPDPGAGGAGQPSLPRADPAGSPTWPPTAPSSPPAAAADPNRPGSASPAAPPRAPAGPRRRARWAVPVTAAVAVLGIAGLLFAVLGNPLSPPKPHSGQGSTRASTEYSPVCATGSLRLVGSTAFMPIAQEVADAYVHYCRGVSIAVIGGDSAYGLTEVKAAVASGSKSMVAMYDGLPSAAYTAGLSPHAVGVLIFSVVAHTGLFPTLNITTEQLQKIFVKPGEQGVVAVGRRAGSGSRLAFIMKVLGLDPDAADVTPDRGNCPKPTGRIFSFNNCTEDSTGHLLAFVNSTPNAIGYADLYRPLADSYPQVSVIAIGNVLPTPDNVRNGSYSFWTVEHLFTATHPSMLTSDFLDFLSHYVESHPPYDFIACSDSLKSFDADC
jgi:serine/threonine protein kinase/ABC-type phosphate transport system substrate-binding protein